MGHCMNRDLSPLHPDRQRNCPLVTRSKKNVFGIMEWISSAIQIQQGRVSGLYLSKQRVTYLLLYQVV